MHLDERDRVAIVTYAGSESVALYPTNCDQKEIILNAIEHLGAGGSTNGSGGLKMAYNLATEMYDPQANNRVILATDGDFNVGISNPQELEDYISTQRGKGIYLTAIGVGMGNYRNDILETLADKGDGNHFYIKNAVEADQVLVKDLGNLITVARDVKLDVQFNPELVKEYRLLGYENRLMPSQDFKDDTRDGGEVGIGHQVVALYEIELGSDTTSATTTDTLVYKTDDIAAVLLRYKPRKENASIERSFHVSESADLDENPSLVLSAALALELRNSPFKGTCSMALIEELAAKVKGKHYEELLQVCARLTGI
jgi:Ca-activated chloride channel homolog